jgi:hypothetical protein
VDPSTAKSRSGWIVFYAACPVCWASKLQSQVALSTTEAEYIAMSQALRDVILVSVRSGDVDTFFIHCMSLSFKEGHIFPHNGQRNEEPDGLCDQIE